MAPPAGNAGLQTGTRGASRRARCSPTRPYGVKKTAGTA